MPQQMDWTEGEEPDKRKRKARSRGKDASGSQALTVRDVAVQEETAEEADPLYFPDVQHLTRKGLRVLPVVTGAVVDAAGNFLFYLDGHDDERSAVQAQLNHLLGSGPSRGESVARARRRASYLLEALTR
jgi:hypothetical protein